MIRFADSESETFLLAPGEVHGWRVALDDASLEDCSRLLATLSPDEQKRADRFKFEEDRRRFIVAHGVLRELLGRYLDTEPCQIKFVYGPTGKPGLAPESGATLSFNLSHSGGLAFVAIAADADVGVDIEEVRPQPDLEDIAHRFFSIAEVEYLMGLPGQLRDRVFFSCWTRSEARVKASGEGLAGHDAGSNGTNGPHGTNGSIESGGSNGADHGRRWSIYTLQPGPGYVGALAVEGEGRHVKERQWRGLSRGKAKRSV